MVKKPQPKKPTVSSKKTVKSTLSSSVNTPSQGVQVDKKKLRLRKDGSVDKQGIIGIDASCSR